MKNEKKTWNLLLKAAVNERENKREKKKITKRRQKSLKWMIIINFKIQNTKYEIENHTTIIITTKYYNF